VPLPSPLSQPLDQEWMMQIDCYSFYSHKILYPCVFYPQSRGFGPQQQWVSNLLGFNFQVEYKPTATNVVADALSWRDTEVVAELAVIYSPSAVRRHVPSEVTDPVLISMRDEVLSSARSATNGAMSTTSSHSVARSLFLRPRGACRRFWLGRTGRAGPRVFS
jgi:hypothetical protein